MFIWAHSILILAQPRPNFPYPYVRTNPSHSFSFLISTIHSKSQTLKAHFFSPFCRPLTTSIPSHSSYLLFVSFSFTCFSFHLFFLHFFIDSTTAKLSSTVLLFTPLPIVALLTPRLYVLHFYLFYYFILFIYFYFFFSFFSSFIFFYALP